jgi:hypothetical protein
MRAGGPLVALWSEALVGGPSRVERMERPTTSDPVCPRRWVNGEA